MFMYVVLSGTILHPVIHFLKHMNYSYLEFISENPSQYPLWQFSTVSFPFGLYFNVSDNICF